MFALNIIVISGLFFIALISIKGCKHLLEYQKNRIDKDIEEKRKILDMIEQENKKILDRTKLLDKKSFELSQIYGAIKKMSGILKKDEITAIHSEFLKDSKIEYSEYLSTLDAQLKLQLKKSDLYEYIEELSITDGLTEIYLRRYFINRLFEEIKRSERLNLKFAVLMADIDYFKRCNDRFGHMVGDVALREIASIIKGTIREIDLVARYGGEEFTVLLPETSIEGALYVAERIRKSIENQVILAYDESLSLTISIGISTYPKDAVSPSALIEKADLAMYQSKQEGRNRVTVWGGKR